LENALRGKGTGWCTAEGSAYAHLQGGDFHVYFTKGDDDKFSQPRIAIRMANGQVAEVRGVNHRQELEPILVDIASSQYHSMPGGEKFDKKSGDMRKMTELTEKQEKSETFTKDDLVFLYEINGQIEGFGHDKDQRIEKLLKTRNHKEDASIMLDCRPEEIAWNQREIKPGTKAYIGPLFPGIFETNIEHICSKFPETPIRKFGLEIGGCTVEELVQQLHDNKVILVDNFEDKLHSQDFTTLKNPEQIDLVRLKVRNLFSDENTHTLNEIYRKAKEFGLELCPAEVGPDLRLKYMNQPMEELIYIATKQIAGRDGDLSLFSLGRWDERLYLGGYYWSYRTEKWKPDTELVFRLRKKDLKI
jgi:hypothetical protein